MCIRDRIFFVPGHNMRLGAIRCAVDVSPCDFGILDVLSLRIEHIVRRAVLNICLLYTSSTTPMMTPRILPMPPTTETPPMTQAAMASRT